MNDLFMPFSQGTRTCLGKNLALMELKLIVATVVKQYRIALGDIMKLGDMDMKDHFLALPKGGKCDFTFTMDLRLSSRKNETYALSIPTTSVKTSRMPESDPSDFVVLLNSQFWSTKPLFLYVPKYGNVEFYWTDRSSFSWCAA
jgi:hypothetical protein